MFFDDPKKTAMSILSRRKASGERTAGPAPMKSEVVKDALGEPDGRHIAAQDILAAVHEASAQKFSEALGHFMDMHQSKGPAAPES